MAHKLQLENKKYRNWVKAGLGTKYVKDGLEPFCDHLVNQQHTDILRKVKKKHNLSVVSCRLCDVRTLQPDHVRTRSRQCPLGQIHCNCQHPSGKITCPNNVCGAIYDEITQRHAFTPPAPYWKNTDAQQWCTEPWAIAKCFINAPGYEQKTRAVEFDCPGLLHVLMNNIEFQQHIKCVITDTDVFSRVRKSRNDIFHSHTMELEDTEVNSYIDDMIELLEDETEIKLRQESKNAVKNLLQLKQEDFIITITDETEIRRVAMAAIIEKERELKQTIVDAGNEIATKTAEGKHELEGNGLVIKSELEQIGQKIRKELAMKDNETKTKADECKHDIEGKCLIMKSELEQIGTKIRNELVMKGEEMRATAAEDKGKLEDKGLFIKAELEQKGKKITKDLIMKGDEIRATATEGKRELKGKGLMIQSELEQTGTKIKKELVMKDDEIRATAAEGIHGFEGKGLIIKSELEQKGKKITKDLIMKGDEIRATAAEDFQKKLVRLYKKHARSVPSFPLQRRRQQVDVSDIYVPPLMTINIQDETTKEWKEVPISMQEIFKNTEMPAKSIYVLGEAGSGKSMFCKILVHFWCIAHSVLECSLDKSDIVKEMGSFRYLFYVSLRHCSDCNSIEEMLEKIYHDPALGDIIQNESSKCLIVLDGLDEWTPVRKNNSQFLTPGLPGRELDANYTIITTSRQWKFDALPITDSEVDKKIKLRGIDQNGIIDLTDKTVKMLNDIFRKSKYAENCKIDLQRRIVSDISHIPLILQQLIFLWFDDKLRENSKYAIYSSMLALLFEWKELKSSENQECEMITGESLINLPLPDYLSKFDTFQENTRVIQYLSHLAYETLFHENKENTLTFCRSTLNRLNIPDDVIKYCLNVGILTEEHNVSLHASIRHQTSYSFFHKSMQEYLAAVFVASKFKQMMYQFEEKKQRQQRGNINAYLITTYNRFFRKDERDLTVVCKEYVLKYFGSCKTVVDILEQANVSIMLCGLEPRLLANVIEYISSVATVDRMVVEERKKVPDQYDPYQRHIKLIKDIQACIFRCIDEIISSEKNVHTPVYIADLYVSPSTNVVRYGENINLKHVLSVEVDGNLISMRERNKEAFYVLLECLTKCDHLKTMKVNDIHYDSSDERFINAVSKILVTNVSTLETISLLQVDKKIISRLVSKISNMRRLVSLQLMGDFSKVPFEVSLSLSKVLNQTISLQHISLISHGEKCKRHVSLGIYSHMIDLSNHRQLQHVDITSGTIYVVSCNTDSLEICKLGVDVGVMNQLCTSLYKACKLNHLDLRGFSCILHPRFGYRTVTKNVIRLLPSLVSLSTLSLSNFFLITILLHVLLI